MFLGLQKQVTYHILHITQLTGKPETGKLGNGLTTT
jgi:hypothetical protein